MHAHQMCLCIVLEKQQRRGEKKKDQGPIWREYNEVHAYSGEDISPSP